MIDEEVELLVSSHRKWEDISFIYLEISEINERYFSTWRLPTLTKAILIHQSNPVRAAFMLRTVLPKLQKDNYVLDWWAMAPNNAVLISVRPFGIEDI